MVAAYVLLAVPLAAALLSWGAWGWLTAAVVVAAVQYATLRRSERFSARLWRSIAMTARSRRERGIETVYVVSVLAGVGLLVRSLLAS